MERASGADGGHTARALAACAAEWAVAKRIEAGGHQVRFREAGSGPAVVLVHGLGVSADYWWRNGPPLAAAGFHVLAPDLPGFGRTDGPEGGLSIPQQEEALIAWLEAMHLPTATFVGHSLSCQTILELGAHEPDRVSGLVLAAPTGDPRPHRLLHQAIGLVRDIRRESFRLAVEVAAAYLQAGPVRVWKTWRLGAQHDPLRLLPHIRTPGLVVVGTRDPVVRRDFAQALAEELGTGAFRAIEGAAHALIFTHADQFNRAVLEFVEGVRSAECA